MIEPAVEVASPLFWILLYKIRLLETQYISKRVDTKLDPDKRGEGWRIGTDVGVHANMIRWGVWEGKGTGDREQGVGLERERVREGVQDGVVRCMLYKESTWARRSSTERYYNNTTRILMSKSWRLTLTCIYSASFENGEHTSQPCKLQHNDTVIISSIQCGG